MRIIAAHCILRPWQPEDASSLARYAGNRNIRKYLRDSFPYPYSEEDAIRFITAANEKTSVQDFAIEVDGQAVGGIGFTPQPDVERVSAEIGYWLGEPYWNREIMSDAVSALKEYVFRKTEILRLFASVFDFNVASMHVLKKAGFRKKAVFEKAAVKDGQIIAMHYYECTR